MKDPRPEYTLQQAPVSEGAAIILSAYALLRFSPAAWRRVLDWLIGPAVRLHDLRNARTRVWRDVLNTVDDPCGC